MCGLHTADAKSRGRHAAQGRLISANRRPPRTAAGAVRILAHVRRLRRNGSLAAQDQGCGSGGGTSSTLVMCALKRVWAARGECSRGGLSLAPGAAGRCWAGSGSMRVRVVGVAARFLATCLCLCDCRPVAYRTWPDFVGPCLDIGWASVQGESASSRLVLLSALLCCLDPERRTLSLGVGQLCSDRVMQCVIYMY